jgi:hypothetical protein
MPKVRASQESSVLIALEGTLCSPRILKNNAKFCELNEDGHLALQAHVLQTCSFTSAANYAQLTLIFAD